MDFPLIIVTLSGLAPGNNACGVLEDESMDDQVGRGSDSVGTICRIFTAIKPGGDWEASGLLSGWPAIPFTSSRGLCDRAFRAFESRPCSLSLR